MQNKTLLRSSPNFTYIVEHPQVQGNNYNYLRNQNPMQRKKAIGGVFSGQINTSPKI